MAYQLKSTGIAANCTMLIAVDPDTSTIKDFASSAVTADMTVGVGVTIDSSVWNGNTRNHFLLSAAMDIAFGDTKPSIKLNESPDIALTIAAAAELPAAACVPFGTNSSNYFASRSIATGSADSHPTYVEGAAAVTGGVTQSGGDKRVFGFSIGYDDGSYAGDYWTALHNDAAMTTGAMSGTGTITAVSWTLTHVGSRNGSSSGFSSTAKWYFIAVFDAELTEAQWDSLRDDWFGVLLEVESGGGSTPVSFSGTIPTQNATEGTPFSVDLSSYFNGTETPFTYAVQSGALPAGLALNSSTGEITGTPTTPGTASGIVIRATDAGTDTADSNSFGIDVAAADTTAPVLTSPTGTATGQTTASGTVSTDEANGTLYYLATTNSTESAATVKGGSSQAVTATGEQSVSVTGLTAATGYYLHYVHRDAAGNDSTVASSSLFTTDAASALVVTEGASDAFAATGTTGGSNVGAMDATEQSADALEAFGASEIGGGGEFPVIGSLDATEGAADAFSASGATLVTGSMAAAEAQTDTFFAYGVTTSVTGSMAAVESGADVWATASAEPPGPAKRLARGITVPVTRRLSTIRLPRAFQ